MRFKATVVRKLKQRLTPEKFDSWFAAKSKDETTLDASDDCRSVVAYHVGDIPEVAVEVREAFSLELGEALRAFLASSDPAKTFVVEIDDDSTSTRYVIDVDGIERRDFGDVNLIGKARYAKDVPCVGLIRGELSLSLTSVTGFNATFDQREIERKLR